LIEVYHEAQVVLKPEARDSEGAPGMVDSLADILEIPFSMWYTYKV
jgi:hypothetical protein